MRHHDALALLDREIARAQRAVSLERAGLAAAPAAALGVAWAAIALIGGFEALGQFPEAVAACLFWLALLGCVAFAVRQWRPATWAEARARLAVDSNLEEAAFDTLEDQPTRLDPITLGLWRRAQSEARAKAVDARARPPRIHFGRYDGLRYLAPLALAAAVYVGAGAGADRLARSLLPDLGVLAGDKPMTIEAWATPAAYTGAAAVSLSDSIGKPVPTPPSVEVTVRLTGPKGPPTLTFSEQQNSNRREVPFRLAADGAYEAKLAVPATGTLSVVRFHTKARWTIIPAVDAAPKIAFTKAPPAAPTKRIQFSWSASDDYGVEQVFLRLKPADPPPGLKDADPIDTPLPAPGGSARAADGDGDLLLYEHPYAGLEVVAQVVAKDALGQVGASEPVRFKMPEKPFSQPLALAAIEIRRMILYERRAYAGAPLIDALRLDRFVDDGGLRGAEAGPALSRAPQAIRRAARLIDAVTMEPDDGTFIDGGVFAGFRMARASLANAEAIEETLQASDMLWQVALHAEHGDGADARRALEAARDRLAQALRNNASKDEIDQLTADLAQAMQDYLEALRQQALAEGQTPQTQEDQAGQNTLNSGDLQKMMDEMKRMADAGDLNAAERMLQQLSQLLENLSVQLGEGPGLGQSQTRGSQAQGDDKAKGLSDALNEQRALRDQTARGGRPQGEPGEGDQPQGKGKGQELGQGKGAQSGDGEGQSDSADARSLADRQDALADQVAQEQARQGKGSRVTESLQGAEQSMREAERALRDGDLAKAEASQEEAMRQLRQGMERLSLEAGRQGGTSRGGRRDPLGRSVGADGDGEETAVPEEVERQRAREILEDLRARAQDPRRSDSEREYLRRLLDRFTGS